jgi:hypothetical protein
MWNMDVVNVTIRNSYFNATLSLTDAGSGSPLASGWRYNVHNNYFDIPSVSQTGVVGYALELDQNSSEVHHNYFDGGANPVSYFGPDAKSGNKVHHNVFANQEPDYYAVMRFDSGLNNFEFYKNTFLESLGTPPTLFRVPVASSPAIHDNIFSSTMPIGDRFGTNIDATNINHNLFYNISSRGTNSVVPGSQPLALSGGFPNAYLPASGAPASLGAFADGLWSVGPG